MSFNNKSWLVPIVKSAAKIFMVLPFGVSLWVARGLGHLGYWLMARKRAVVYANLRTVFVGAKTPKQLLQLSHKVFVNFAQSFVELLCLPKIKRLGVERYVDIIGEKNIDVALNKGRGVIFVTMHLGSWELASVVGSTGKYPYNIVANEQPKTPQLDHLLNDLRRIAGAKVIVPGVATREIIKVLKNNEIVTLVLDQGGKEGVPISFFGKTASIPTGAMRIAQKYGAAVCPVLFSRTKGKHQLNFYPDIALKDTGNFEEDVLANIRNIVPFFESLIKEHADEYMWFYKVYKYTTEPHIVILDDGRMGHLRQSQAVAKGLEGVLKKRNKYPKQSTVLVAFRSDVAAKLFSLYSAMAQYLPWLRGEGCLKYFLTPRSYQEVLSVKADYVISTGSKVAGVNYLLKLNHMAKSINILTPGLLSPKRFDLNVVPEHDTIASRKARWLKTKVALNLVNPAYLKANSDGLLKYYSHLKGNARLKIGLLIGGNTKGIIFDEAKMRVLINHLKEAALHFNADILLTTSRRTPPAVEQMLLKELKSFERCALCIIANQQNIPQAVGGILGLSDLVIVSGESVSMVSEAVSSGRKTIVFDPRGSYAEKARDKYEQFVLRLHDEGYVMASSIKDIPAKITQLLSHKIQLKTLDDEGRLVQALEGVL